MSITVLLLLLQEQPQRLSKVVIVGAALAFITGVALVVYFYRRFKATEKEPEEDWQVGMHALFVESPAAAAPEKTSGTRILSSESAEANANARIEQTIAAELYPTAKPEATIPESKTELFGAARPVAAEPNPPAKTPAIPAAETTQSIESLGPVMEKADFSAGGTQVLSSVPAETLPSEPSPFDDEVFADLETTDSARTGLTIALTDSTAEKKGEPIEVPQETKAQVRAPSATRPFEFSRKATPAEPQQRQAYEPPDIFPIKHREAYEPPAIRRLEPREAPATPTRPAVGPRETPGETARPWPSTKSAPAAAPQEPSLATARFGSPGVGSPQPAGIGSRVPAGSVLGLPATASNAPLKLGAPARPQADVGIGVLVNYGKETETGGKGGTIALAVVVLLVAGAILSYRFVPSVNSRVNHWVQRIRGTDQEHAQLAAQQPKAKILPRNSQPDKNVVTAGGAVENISDPPITLENLEVEVSLQRGNGGPPENRRVAISPSTLEPGQRGTFEFQYDGKRDTGFVMYKIVKLWSGDNPIRFTAPGLNR
jgi:hypothetical protein